MIRTAHHIYPPHNVSRFWRIIWLCMIGLQSFNASADPTETAAPENVSGIRKSGFHASVKTNLLSDALAVPQVAAEFYVGRDFSVEAEWMYAWWGKEYGSLMWRIYGGSLTARRWFGRAASAKPLTGHHAGVYVGAFTFDFILNHKGYMGGLPSGSLWDRCMLNAGVEYGYSLPIARRLNLDFSIGIGYVGGMMERYRTEDDIYIWQSTVRKHWFGPTRAAVSLVWLLGPSNFNLPRKGGGA